MKIKTSELTGLALDWAVAESEGNVRLQYDSREGLIIRNILGWIPYRPSVAWVQGGPIIERENICLNWAPRLKEMEWEGYTAAPEQLSGEVVCYGPTPLIAAMRCLIALKLGDEVDVPKELVCTS